MSTPVSASIQRCGALRQWTVPIPGDPTLVCIAMTRARAGGRELLADPSKALPQSLPR